MKEYLISNYTEEQLRFRLLEIEEEIKKQLIKDVDRQSSKLDACVGKDEAYGLKYSCSKKVGFNLALPSFDLHLEKEIRFLGQCNYAQTVREAKRLGCLAK